MHGTRLGPRRNTWDAARRDAGALAYVAWPSGGDFIDDASDAFVDRTVPPFDLFIAAPDDTVWQAVPELPAPGQTLVLWWRRPRTGRGRAPVDGGLAKGEVPWPLDGTVRLYRADLQTAAVEGRLRSWYGGPRDGTGYMALDATRLWLGDPDVASDVRRAWTQ